MNISYNLLKPLFNMNVSFAYKVSLGAMALLLGKSLIRSFITNDLVHPQRTQVRMVRIQRTWEIFAPLSLVSTLFPNLVFILALFPNLVFILALFPNLVFILALFPNLVL
jgi:hypothetical protein